MGGFMHIEKDLIHLRLIFERKRLGLTQIELQNLLSEKSGRVISRKIILNLEKGIETKLDVELLSLFESIGYNMEFVLTGKSIDESTNPVKTEITHIFDLGKLDFDQVVSILDVFEKHIGDSFDSKNKVIIIAILIKQLVETGKSDLNSAMKEFLSMS